MTGTQVHVVVHTHWDREWYEPFQTFRLRLLHTVDAVLELIERDPAFVFTFDGQTAAIEDYLALRPEQEDRVRRHVEAGRLLIGPWRILSDEFLPSGETLIRNLEAGWAVAERLGGPMRVGYLPDMFGHVAQMPQLLARSGLRDAVVWRGVPAAVDRHAFTWVGPDGSSVRAEYLLGGYGHAAHLLDDPDRAAEDVQRFRRRMAAFAPDGHLLMLHGGDHIAPRADLTANVATADAGLDDVAVAVSTLPAYLEAVRDQGPLPVWHGELRSAARANLLMGVTSTRVDIKARAARAERALERYAEPLLALFGDRWPAGELALAWSRLIENSAHDSICACSHDETVAQVGVRYEEAARIGEELAGTVLAGPAGRVSVDGAVAWNPSPHARADDVAVDVAADRVAEPVALRSGDGHVVAAQVVASHPEVLLDREGSAADALAVLERRHARELFGQLLSGFAVDDATTPPTLTVTVDRSPHPPQLDVDGFVAEVHRAVADVGAPRWRVVLRARPYRRVRARVPAPPLGWTTVTPTAESAVAAPAHPAARQGHRLANGLVTVDVADDGTLTLQGEGVHLPGVGRLVDGGDAGDTYNYAPPTADQLIDAPDEVEIVPRLDGPVVSAVEVVRRYRWPTRLAADRGGRSRATVAVTTVTAVEVRADEPFVRVDVTFDNPARDHRLRWHAPLPEPVAGSRAQGQLAVVERGLAGEGGHGEHPLATAPAQSFVTAGPLALLLDQVTEYEVVDGRELAMTLLRATGHVSVNDNPYRAEPAGPQLPVPGNQMLGRCAMTFALRPVGAHTSLDHLVGDAERYRLPFLQRSGSVADGDHHEAVAAGLTLQGDAVALSALRADGDGLQARLVNLAAEPCTAQLTGPFSSVQRVSLLGTPEQEPAPVDGRADLELGPCEIATLRLGRRP